MDSSAIQSIVKLGQPNLVEEYGYKYSDKALNVICTPKASTLNLSTLKGLVELVKQELKSFNAPLVVHIDGFASVTVYSPVNGVDRSRECPYCVSAEVASFQFGRWLGYEDAIIQLRSKFVETPELLDVISLLGTIVEENSATTADDGFTQSVVVRKGIALKDNKVVKPIVKLKPYRTFVEVEQPESEFLLRLSDGANVALFEADGGAWKLKARANVADYLHRELEELVADGNVIIVE